MSGTGRTYRYTIIVRPDIEAGGYTVEVPSLPGCLAQGETLEEAIALAREAIALHIQGLVEEGEPVPEESGEEIIARVEVAA